MLCCAPFPIAHTKLTKPKRTRHTMAILRGSHARSPRLCCCCLPLCRAFVRLCNIQIAYLCTITEYQESESGHCLCCSSICTCIHPISIGSNSFFLLYSNLIYKILKIIHFVSDEYMINCGFAIIYSLKIIKIDTQILLFGHSNMYFSVRSEDLLSVVFMLCVCMFLCALRQLQHACSDFPCVCRRMDGKCTYAPHAAASYRFDKCQKMPP